MVLTRYTWDMDLSLGELGATNNMPFPYIEASRNEDC